MLQHVMTDTTFAKGLKNYLTDRYQQTAVPEDLYRNMQTAFNSDFPTSTLNIAQLMRTWELQPGYPVISVNRVASNLILAQERYHQNSIVDETNSTWTIPVNFATKSQPDYSKTTPDFLMTTQFMIIPNGTHKTWAANDWVLLNIQETGYYRVNYDINTWKLLSNELDRGNLGLIHVVNRAQLIDDSFNLARTQRLSYSVAFDILLYLARETDYIPWASTDRALSFLHSYLVGSPEYPRFRKMMRDNANAIYNRLGTEARGASDLFLDIYGRNLAINWACSMGHEKCLQDTSALMDLVARNIRKIEPDLETVVYCNGIRRATEVTFNALLTTALLPANATMKTIIMSSLGCSEDSNILSNYLMTSISTARNYEAADRARVITSVYTNGGLNGIDMVLDFVTGNYSTIAAL